MNYYPGSTFILNNTQITRERLLPPGLNGEVLVTTNAQVTPTTIVARGTRPADYAVVNIAEKLNIDPDNTAAWKKALKVKVGEMLDINEALTESRRGPRSPVNGQIVLIEHGRVVIEVLPETIEIQAQLEGIVTEIFPDRGVAITAQGSLLQCAWGNGRFTTAPYTFEPGYEYGNVNSRTGGLIDLMGQDTTLSRYRGKVVILMRALTESDLEVVIDQELMGLVAPCAPVYLREKAMQHTFPVILTEGFGQMPPTTRLYDILNEKRNNAAIFDAALPDPRGNVRPEIVIASAVSRQDRLPPVTDVPLQVGMSVRMRRSPYTGQIGEITALPELPQVIENGMRVLCAQIKFPSGERATVPLANIDSLGE